MDYDVNSLCILKMIKKFPRKYLQNILNHINQLIIQVAFYGPFNQHPTNPIAILVLFIFDRGTCLHKFT